MIRKLLFACVLSLFLPALALGQGTISNAVGPRVGLSIDPDQLAFGGQFEFGGIAPDVTIVPSLELGFGDDVTTVQMNGDFHYHFDISGSAWRPYAGAGIGIAFYSFDLPPGFVGDDSNTEVGLNILGGAMVPTEGGSRFFTELRVGIEDLPDLKMLVGWNFAF